MTSFRIGAIVVALGVGALVLVPASATNFTSVPSSEIKWVDAPSIGPGAKTAVIEGDPKGTGPFVMRLKVPPNTKIGVHTHPADENVTVLSGTLYFAASDKYDAKAAKAFDTGSYFSIAKGKPMFAYTKNKEAVLQLHGTGPWGVTYADPADAAPKKKS